MRYTYNTINTLEKVADKIVSLNYDSVRKVPGSGIHSPPYLYSKIDLSLLKIPKGWRLEGNHIINTLTLIYLEVFKVN